MDCSFCIGGDSGEYCSEECKDAAEVKFCLDGGQISANPGGTKEWSVQGWLHRKDGPARVLANGTKEWCQFGDPHRKSGPAIDQLRWLSAMRGEDGAP